MSAEEKLIVKYFELRNQQIEMLRAAVPDMDRAIQLGQRSEALVERLDRMLPELRTFEDAVDYAEIKLLTGEDLVEVVPGVLKPKKVDTAVNKILKEVGLPTESKLQKIQDTVRQYVEYYNEQTELANRLAEVINDVVNFGEEDISGVLVQLEEEFGIVEDDLGPDMSYMGDAEVVDALTEGRFPLSVDPQKAAGNVLANFEH